MTKSYYKTNYIAKYYFLILLIILIPLLTLVDAGSFSHKEEFSTEEVNEQNLVSLLQKKLATSEEDLNNPEINPIVKRHLSWYKNHPGYLNQKLSKAGPFIYYVMEEAEKQKIPAEIALLPLIESEYHPVVSHHGPSGLWQMTTQTAKNFGLTVSDQYDGRNNIPSSTKAALKYIRYLHGIYNDWMLSIAAYNLGEGKLSRLIKKNENDSSETKNYLAATRYSYLPKILALTEVFRHPKEYKLHLVPINQESTLTTVNINKSKIINLSKNINKIGLNINSIKKLNPDLANNVSLPKNIPLLIPKNQAKIILSWLNNKKEKTAL